MDDVAEKAKAPKRTAEDVMREIEAKLATVDGIATADAFALGRMIREYGQVIAGEASSSIMVPLLDMMLKPKPGNGRDADSEKPWL